MGPSFEDFFLPILEAASQGEIHTRELVENMAERFHLSKEDRAELIPSGEKTRLADRVTWAKTYLKQAGLLEYTRRGYCVATAEGRRVAAQKPDRVDRKFLERYEEFLKFRKRKGTRKSADDDPSMSGIDEDSTPDERLREAHAEITSALEGELLDRVLDAPPEFFENLILKLLEAMGYGGTSDNASRPLGKSGDQGVDGVIDQDSLGVDQIYVQAKRYAKTNSVGAGEIRDFFGALNLKKAQKGIFFTTSEFSQSARHTAEQLGVRIVLIDGPQLSGLMVRYNVGCREEERLYLKKIDEEFFQPEDI